MSKQHFTTKPKQFTFLFTNPPAVAGYQSPDIESEPLHTLLVRLTQCYANNWHHLAGLVRQRIEANCAQGADHDQ